MHASYGDEVSNLRISKVVGEFFFKHVRNTFKRIFYNYYLRDLSLASLQLPMGMLLLIFGVLFGLYKWNEASSLGVTATPGTVMLSALPVLVGIELILAFIGQDVQSVPQRPFLRTSRTLERFKNPSASVTRVIEARRMGTHTQIMRGETVTSAPAGAESAVQAAGNESDESRAQRS